MQASNNFLIRFLRNRPRWQLVLTVLVLAAGAWWVFRESGSRAKRLPTFEARRGPLEINVTEGGSLQALESQAVKCEVRVGYQGTKILKIVEEGYQVTEEDVKNGKVLVELDSSDLQKQLVQQEIQCQSTAANLTDAEQNYQIQVNQNASDIKAAEQKVRFARMDLEKFLGDTVAAEIIQKVGLDKMLAAAETNDVSVASAANVASTEMSVPKGPPSSGGPLPDQLPVVVMDGSGSVRARPGARPPVAKSPPSTPATAPSSGPENAGEPPVLELPATLAIDFSSYADTNKLGDGEAKQKLRKLEDDLQVAEKEMNQATNTLDGTIRLFEKNFATSIDKQRDEIAFENSRLKVQTAKTAQALYNKYEFPKTAEETLSKYADAVRELDKARRVALSKLAQSKARLRSSEGQYQVQTRQLQDIKDQLDKCVIRAEKPGLVVYGAGGDQRVFYGNEEPVREGATVRERQAIITIPDLSKMAVNVRIHESYIKKVKKGQKAEITVDAFPDKTLHGEVTKVAVLPDSQNRYMNPDLKVYLTTVTIDGTHDWVKPGMSAKVNILVDRLDDVVYVPLQSVQPLDGGHCCFVAHGLKPERRDVEVGEFNDDFIEIKSGLSEGELVYLTPPEGFNPGGIEGTEGAEPNPSDAPPTHTETAALPH